MLVSDVKSILCIRSWYRWFTIGIHCRNATIHESCDAHQEQEVHVYNLSRDSLQPRGLEYGDHLQHFSQEFPK